MLVLGLTVRIQTLGIRTDDALTGAVIEENDDADGYCIDVVWQHLFQMKSPVGNHYRFRLLFNVTRLVMVAPHSKGRIEFVYGLMKKNTSKGSDRNRLDIEGMLSLMLAAKFDQPEVFSR